MFVNMLQCTGQPPTATNYLAQHVYSAEIVNPVNLYF